jgi:cold shock CspA family protein
MLSAPTTAGLMSVPSATSPAIKFGRCKWFGPERPYGFFVPDSGGRRALFFHRNDVIGPDPRADQRVSFILGENRDGRKCATQVRIL